MSRTFFVSSPAQTQVRLPGASIEASSFCQNSID
jgi:hypothetical protein